MVGVEGWIVFDFSILLKCDLFDFIVPLFIRCQKGPNDIFCRINLKLMTFCYVWKRMTKRKIGKRQKD